ncbi:hypothetical protein PRIPAC_70333 [Pristionchus pacificus]|uniref:Uncharacterized protein n=1 Tax=Pristionchus pacificus TaxID=54126 RepID=A0A2A6C6H6_PRIPA|nr:hypothetical protein PRIPAC_70333 [Pristionchus pacificus]|eukprot:PDM73716.1 hypothetical protein PRIPAC_41072 [Pristionchus pacificus]
MVAASANGMGTLECPQKTSRKASRPKELAAHIEHAERLREQFLNSVEIRRQWHRRAAVCVRFRQIRRGLAQLKNLDSLKMCFWGFSRALMMIRILIFHIEPSLAPDDVTSKTRIEIFELCQVLSDSNANVLIYQFAPLYYKSAVVTLPFPPHVISLTSLYSLSFLMKFTNPSVNCPQHALLVMMPFHKSSSSSSFIQLQWGSYRKETIQIIFLISFLSLISGTAPSAWKHSLITPIGSKQVSPRYSINSTVLPLENNVRDLGAQVRSDLKNSSSIKMLAQKAISKMFLLLKALPFNCPSILIRSYKAYVLPLLDFASPFWNPHYTSDIAILEKVQHTFTRQLFYRCFPSPDYPLSLPSYSDRIKTLGLRALTERRVIGDLCMTHMIMNGFTIIPRSLFYVYKPLRDRTSSFGINIELTTSTPRYHSFPVRTSRWYSQLPDSIRTAPNIRMFKRRLENHPIISHLAKLT